MACCKNRKNYFVEGKKIIIYSHHGRNIPFTRELMDEIKKFKIVETGFFFNQKLEINSRKRKREEDDSLIGFITNCANNFFRNNEEPDDPEGLPEGIEELILGTPFDKPIDNLPSTIQKIQIGQEFNKSINNLPDGLKKLRFFYLGLFNQPIDFLPCGLEYLELPNEFNHPLNNLPVSLKYLKIGSKFDYDLNNLPDSIEKLVLPNNYKKEIKRFPKKLKLLCISNEYPFPIPDSIERRKRISVKFYKINPSSNN